MKGAKILIVSGPAGSGKNTVCERLMQKYANVERILTSTSRAPRGQEKDMVDYKFFSKKEFENLILQDAFYEWAKVHDNYYGTLKSAISEKLKQGKNLLLIIDVQGAKSWAGIAEKNPEIKERLSTIFIMPPSIDELKNRLTIRDTESQSDIEKRMQTAILEMREFNIFERIIYSKSKEEDFAEFEKIYLEITQS